MKRLLILALAFFSWGSFSCEANQPPLDLIVCVDDNTKTKDPAERSVEVAPIFYVENHLLTFEAATESFVVELWSKNAMVYSQKVMKGATDLELPDYLCGEYYILIKSAGKICLGSLSL